MTNETSDDSTREVQLVFAPRSGGGLEKTKFGVKEFSAKVDEIKDWFKDYKVSSIELWIQGAVKEERDVLKLLVSIGISGSLKVTLEPRQ